MFRKRRERKAAERSARLEERRKGSHKALAEAAAAVEEAYQQGRDLFRAGGSIRDVMGNSWQQSFGFHDAMADRVRSNGIYIAELLGVDTPSGPDDGE